MTEVTERLRLLAAPDRADELESLVVAEFRAALMLPEHEDLPLDESFFDLGMTSLLLVGLKERLEALLSVQISANALFNRPTVAALVDHLNDLV
ncbi:acyl carrier protein [Streptosporangiaceae bacterium NEAU-GS5]|nr:acyl carrier protein [Streptosporangiaceae bacterium NEAU-GS5]